MARPQLKIGWTESPLTTANTNRDGSGTVEKLFEVTDAGATYIDSVQIHTLGTNAATEGILIGTYGNGLADTANNFVIAVAELPATTAGTPASTDTVLIQVGAWFNKSFEIYAQVHDTQAAGRQAVIYSDASYQQF